MSMQEGKAKRLWFDGTLTVQHVLIAATILGSLVTVYATNVAALNNHETRIVNVETILHKQENTNRLLLDLLVEMRSTVAVVKDRQERK